MKYKILISACLMGENVKYDGGNNLCEHPILTQWKAEGCLVSVCPEVLGGMTTPRIPCEVVAGEDSVFNAEGEDKTDFFLRGANLTWERMQEEGIVMAILKARSPSCGKGIIYDGSFSHTKVLDSGVTCKLLLKHGIHVFCEDELEDAYAFWKSLHVKTICKNTHSHGH